MLRSFNIAQVIKETKKGKIVRLQAYEVGTIDITYDEVNNQLLVDGKDGWLLNHIQDIAGMTTGIPGVMKGQEGTGYIVEEQGE
jgi:hypothetical protein